ncbi:MAG: PIG-L deacetylase family protein [Steroidobacteraceae bacterium]
MIARFGNPSQVLCIGAHCDDIEIGCGATLLRLARESPACRFTFAVFSGDETRAAEARAAAAALVGVARVSMQMHQFRGSYFPAQYAVIKDAMEALKSAVPAPDLILTHRLEDRHQDHALLAELTWNTWRTRQILEYEIPKYEGDLGQPNCYIAISRRDLERKVEVLMSAFATQSHKPWFDSETFRGLARIRGLECNAPEKFAEGFYARKLCL